MPAEPVATSSACTGCGAELPSRAVVCPSCHRLVHKERLDQLARDAAAETARGDRSAALAHWREALDLLPQGSRQLAAVQAKVDALSQEVDAAGPKATGPAPKWLAALGGFGLLLWKFKFVLVFVATKGKLLLLGLTKASTFLSMFVAFGAYWALWGWWFAAGLVGTTYVHEIGHVAAMRRYGIKADAPMFIPGLGAFVRLRQRPSSPREDARIGLAGPEWGLAISALCLGLGFWQGWPALAAVGKFSALINLFNLLPVSSLDGARGFNAMSTRQRWWAVGSVALAWFWTGEGLLILLLAATVFAAFKKDAPAEGDRRAVVTYAVLALALSYLATIVVDAPPRR